MTLHNEYYELDVKNTLISNIFAFMYLIVIVVFATTVSNIIHSFDSLEIRLLFTLMYMLMVVELMLKAGALFNLEYKPRE